MEGWTQWTVSKGTLNLKYAYQPLQFDFVSVGQGNSH